MRDKIFTGIGLGLLAICFVASLLRIAWPDRSQPGGNASHGPQKILRFAHWQLEGGVRNAFDQISAEYTKRHPDVRLEQLPIPEKIFQNWLVTQLVGETAPDLIELGHGITDELLARYFSPVADLARTPNPYDAGTALEGMALRDTFFDGMLGGYFPNLLDYYGVPVSAFSMRMFYNLDLLRAVQGNAQIPRTYAELDALCRRVEQYAPGHNRALVPIAGSTYISPPVLSRLFSSQTQKLSEALNPVGILGNDPWQVADAYLTGRWSLDTPEVRSGLALMHAASLTMQPAFLEFQRDDAMLMFAQGRALMIASGTWDATSIRQQCDFPLVIGTVPTPQPDDPAYGRYTLGNFTEAGLSSGVSFGVTRQSAQPELARDFLRFLGSQPMNQIWTDVSGWIPAVIGVKTTPEVTPLLPVADGYLGGFDLSLHEGLSGDVSRVHEGLFGDVSRAVWTHLPALVGPLGSPEAFLDGIRPEYARDIGTDLQRGAVNTLDNLERTDTQLAGIAWLAQEHPRDADAARRLDNALQAAVLNESAGFRLQYLRDKADTLMTR